VDGDQGRIRGLGMSKARDEVEAGAETASSVPSSSSRRERASATVFDAPDRYSTEKSNPSSLPTQ